MKRRRRSQGRVGARRRREKEQEKRRRGRKKMMKRKRFVLGVFSLSGLTQEELTKKGIKNTTGVISYISDK